MPRRPRPHRPGTSRALGAIPRIALALAILAAAALAGAGWYFSDLIIRPELRKPLESGLVVSAIDDSTITLEGSRLARTGRVWFLEWAGGSAEVGDVVALDNARVTRRLHLLEGRLAVGASVDLGSFLYRGDPLLAHGLPFEEVLVTSHPAVLPAWFVPGARRTWMVFVHGRSAGRGEALRLMSSAHGLGFPFLAITYRNGPDAPPSADRLHHLGATEWEDLEAGVRYALQMGARRVVLAGYSMGGAVVAEFLRRSTLADSVAGVILDAPALDWDAAVGLGARQRGVSYVTPIAELAVSLRTGFRWSDSGPSAWRRQFRRPTPILLFHGTADLKVPIAPSEAFAATLGERVTIVKFPGAGHVQSWNFDPERYERVVRQWVSEVVRDSS